MITLILIRHGETAWNRERRVQGQLDVELNDEGRRQALATAERLATDAARYGLGERDAPRIVSSDLSRARQTAQAIVDATGLPLSLDARLRERAYGLFEGKRYEEIERDLGDDFRRWVSRDPDFNVHGGESLNEFYARSRDALVELADSAAAAGSRTLVVVSHGGVLDCAYRLARGLPLTAPREHELLNASLNRIRWNGARFELLDWGDVQHWRPALDDAEQPV